jgi:putative hemolysin
LSKSLEEVRHVQMDIALSIVITLLLAAFSGVFSMSEMALVNARRAILEPEAEEGDRKAQAALDLSANTSQFLAAIQVAITLVGFFASAIASMNLSDPFSAWMVGLGVPGAHVLAPIVITLVVSYVSIVVGELVPKRIGLADAENVAKRMAGFIRGFVRIAKPLVWLTSASASGICKLLHVREDSDRQNVSEEEIKYMVTDADELSDEEKSMIHDVIDLGDTSAREVMIPRVDMTAVEDTETMASVLDLMRRTGYSRIPVFHEDVDRIVGVAHIKDLIGPIIDDGEARMPVTRHLRTPDFVPDTKDIIPLLSEMQSSHDQMVIVVDEYGGTAGIITIEDIVEEVVGEIEDEFDPDNKYLTQLSEREWLVDGRFPIDDSIELGWPIADSDEYETVAGFLLDIADSLPSPGDVFNVEGYIFRVQSMRGRRISLLRVTAPERVEPEPEGDGEREDAKRDAGEDE